LECIEESFKEKVSPNVAKLVEGIASSIDDLFKDFASTQKVVEDHTSRFQQKQKLVQQANERCSETTRISEQRNGSM